MKKKNLLLATCGVLLVTGVFLSVTEWRENPDKVAASSGTTGAGTVERSSGAPSSGLQALRPSSNSASEADAARHFRDLPHYKAALGVAGMAEGPTRSEAMEALIETWVASSPVDAADWAGSLPSGSFRDDALSALMFHWAAAAPADAAAWMARTGVDDPEAASTLAGKWAAADALAASVWAAGLSDPVMRRDAITGVAGAWAERAPEAAAAWVKALPADEKPAAAVALIAAWAESAPASAATWLLSQKEAGTESQAAALAVLTTAWGEKNPAAVSKFLNSLPEGPAREAAASQFAVAAAPTAPAEALAWAMNLTDPAQRNQVVADACESWYDGAQEGFRAGISEALAFMDDASMRKGVYEMLYDRDPTFHDNLLNLTETKTAPSVPAPEVHLPAPEISPDPGSAAALPAPATGSSAFSQSLISPTPSSASAEPEPDTPAPEAESFGDDTNNQ